MAVFGGRHDVVGLDVPEVDITDAASVADAFARVSPGCVVNCAAYTQVDACEPETELARRVNADGPRLLADAAARAGARLIHLSTDYVFDGARPVSEAYTEADAAAPASAYGRSKLAGEQAVLERYGEAVIVRTAWLYGAAGRNFLKTMLRLAVSDPERVIRVVNDQHGCPTWSKRLAEQLERLAVEPGAAGIYHAVAHGHCTWYELAAAFLEATGVPHRLEPCSTDQYPTPARRPANSVLANRRLQEAGWDLMRPWRDDVLAFVAAHRDRLMDDVKEID
jgi:dTDP-4-dehydrorhamnose reductase